MTSDCYPCRMWARLDDLPPRERVAVHGGWRIAHAFDTSLPGWLCVLPRRHITSLAELNGDEARTLGPLLAAGSAALQQVLACEKTYAMLFAEREGFAHLHFHLVPRMVDFDAAVEARL